MGTFSALAGEGARLVTPTDVVHAAPKAADNGQVTFNVGWTAPATRGTVVFEAFAVAANNDRSSGGDAAGQGRASVAVGCTGVERFVDADGDGYGSMALPKEQVCEGSPGFTDRAGDCNDYLAYVHPMAPELCNGIDDNCNGQADEGLDKVTMYRDADGDGFGAHFTTDTRVGCSSSGYAPNQDDCDDKDKDVHPGAMEVCNSKDDDCNGRTDEGARATCGLGWCLRNAMSCESSMCTPGKPRMEECNLYDDDCDGVIDNGAQCEAGKVCFQGRCLASDDAKAAAEAMASADGGVAGADGGVAGAADGGVSPGPDGRRARPRGTSGCSYGGGVNPGWPLLAALLVIARSARCRGGRRGCCRRSPPRS
jgi:Putative metal-binding motif